MGWRDRDWARLNDAERRNLYAPGGGYGRSSRVSPGVGLAVAVSLALAVVLYAVGHYPRGHRLLPGLALGIPSFGSSDAHTIIATSTAQYGSTYTLNGTTPGGNGVVEADGSWNGQPWQVLATVTTIAGSYNLQFPLTETGTLKLRVRYPGGEADGAVLVL